MSTFRKYPRTFHLPFSPGLQNDDRLMESLSGFEGKEVVVTIKLDGESTTLYNDGYHARSISSIHHPSRSWVKRTHGIISHLIPDGYRLVGENCYATHSIHYSNLESYFYLISIWNDKNEALSWDETLDLAKTIGLIMVPVIYRGLWDYEEIKNLYAPVYNGDECEGFVIRTAHGFHYNDFQKYVAKYVRRGHVQPDEGHWMTKQVVPNKLRN